MKAATMIQIIKQVYYVFATVALLLIAFFANRADLSVVKMLLLALGLLVHLLMMIQHRSLQYLWKTSYGMYWYNQMYCLPTKSIQKTSSNKNTGIQPVVRFNTVQNTEELQRIQQRNSQNMLMTEIKPTQKLNRSTQIMFKSTISEIVDRERIKPAKINEQSQVLKNLVDLRAAYNKALSLKREQQEQSRKRRLSEENYQTHFSPHQIRNSKTGSHQNKDQLKKKKQFQKLFYSFNNTLNEQQTTKQSYFARMKHLKQIIAFRMKQFIRDSTNNLEEIGKTVEDNFEVRIVDSKSPRMTIEESISLSFTMDQILSALAIYFKNAKNFHACEGTVIWQAKRDVNTYIVRSKLLTLYEERLELDSHLSPINQLDDSTRSKRMTELKSIREEITSQLGLDKKQQIFQSMPGSGSNSDFLVHFLRKLVNSEQPKLSYKLSLCPSQGSYIQLLEQIVQEGRHYDIRYRMKDEQERKIHCLPGKDNIWSVIQAYFWIKNAHPDL